MPRDGAGLMPGAAGTRDAPDPCFSPQDEGRARRRAGLFRPPDAAAEVDEVHISVAFTYDKMFADHLAESSTLFCRSKKIRCGSRIVHPAGLAPAAGQPVQ